MSLLRRSLLATWWSLPLGLADGARVALEAGDHNSLFSDAFHLRAAAAAAVVVLFYAAVFFLVALAGGAAGALVSPMARDGASRLMDVAVFLALEAGFLLLLVPGRLGPSGTAGLVGACWIGGWAGFRMWQHAAGRWRVPMFAAACLLYGGMLVVQGIVSRWSGSAAVAAVALLLSLLLGWSWPGRALHQAAVVAACLLLAAAGALAPDVAPAASVPEGPPRPVILITVDTLRADAISASGTPHLSELAREAVQFRRAYAPSPWTIPSVNSLLTSRLPHEIGMTGEAGYVLADDVLRLPELLPSDFEARAVATNVFGVRRWGSWKGFDAVESADLSSVVGNTLTRALVLPRLVLGLRPLHYPFTEARAEDVTRRGIRHMDALAGSSFLLWLHYYDPHSPYDPPAPFDEDAGPERPKLRDVRRTSLGFLRSGMKLQEADRDYVRALYGGEVRYTDQEIGRLLEAVRERGLWDQALIVLASDHGEEFWEHGLVEHGHTLFEEQLRVPLLVKFPGNRHAGRSFDGPVSLLDILPTIAEELDLRLPPGLAVRGRSLGSLLQEAEPPPRPLYFEGTIHFRELKAAQRWPWKLIHDPATGRDRLFQLEEDASERFDRSAAEPAVVEQLRGVIDPYVAAEDAAGGPDAIDPALRQRLRALGYVQ